MKFSKNNKINFRASLNDRKNKLFPEDVQSRNKNSNLFFIEEFETVKQFNYYFCHNNIENIINKMHEKQINYVISKRSKKMKAAQIIFKFKNIIHSIINSTRSLKIFREKTKINPFKLNNKNVDYEKTRQISSKVMKKYRKRHTINYDNSTFNMKMKKFQYIKDN